MKQGPHDVLIVFKYKKELKDFFDWVNDLNNMVAYQDLTDETINSIKIAIKEIFNNATAILDTGYQIIYYWENVNWLLLRDLSIFVIHEYFKNKKIKMDNCLYVLIDKNDSTSNCIFGGYIESVINSNSLLKIKINSENIKLEEK